MNFNKLLEGKKALITSGAQGIGKSVAMTFAKHGATVYIADINKEKLIETYDSIKTYSPKSKYYICDMGNYDQLINMCNTIAKDVDGIDILVNSVGINKQCIAHNYDENDLTRLFDVNYKSALRCMKYFLPYMIDQKSGNIINISSIHSEQSMPKFLLYAGTKGALNASMRAAALDYAEEGIRINTICPGLIISDNIIDEIESYVITEEKNVFVDMLSNMQPLKPGKVEDVAYTALFLASDMSSYITGQAIMVDGGASIKGH